MANVVIRNKRGHLIKGSVLDDQGRLVELKLQAHEISAPMDEARVGTLTRRLASQGRLVISPAP